VKLTDILNRLTDQSSVENWIKNGIQEIKLSDIEESIQKQTDPGEILIAQIPTYLHNPLTATLIKSCLMQHWAYISGILSSTSNVYNILTENRADIKQILDTPKGRTWLNKACIDGYTILYNLTWDS
jgi:ribosomal protein L11 methylase PrmA